MSNQRICKYIFKAVLVLEAETPIFVGSGLSDIKIDSLAVRGPNGYPFIPGTGMAGVLRAGMSERAQHVFGFQDKDKGEGSRIIVSHAYIVGPHGKVCEGLDNLKADYDNLHRVLTNLPVRKHVAINERGAAKDTSLFDNEVLYRGTRFALELTYFSDNENDEDWQLVLKHFEKPNFRVGGGTRKGYGLLKLIGFKKFVFDLNDESGRRALAQHPYELTELIKNTQKPKGTNISESAYVLELKARDFLMFGSGKFDNDTDHTIVVEDTLVYNDNGVIKIKERPFIPGSSIKGVLRHRFIYHYNKITENYADEPDQEIVKVKDDDTSKAVRELFGFTDGSDQARGRVFIDDVFLSLTPEIRKLFQHVAIDRFTGGALDAKLFSEKALYAAGMSVNIPITIEKHDELDEKILKAFKCACKDIADGLLPLGGMTTKGHGFFSGQLKERKNGQLV